MTGAQPAESPKAEAMNHMLAHNWWAVALRGVVALLFGITAFAMPLVTMLSLVAIFAAFSFVDGVFGIIMSVRGARKGERWIWLLINGTRYRHRRRRHSMAQHNRARLRCTCGGMVVDNGHTHADFSLSAESRPWPDLAVDRRRRECRFRDSPRCLTLCRGTGADILDRGARMRTGGNAADSRHPTSVPPHRSAEQSRHRQHGVNT